MEHSGKQVPAIFSEPSATKRALDSLFALSYYIKFMGGKDQVRASASDLIGATIKNMGSVVNPSNAQWYIYSGHDVTIAIVLAIFDMWNADCIF